MPNPAPQRPTSHPIPTQPRKHAKKIIFEENEGEKEERSVYALDADEAAPAAAAAVIQTFPSFHLRFHLRGRKEEQGESCYCHCHAGGGKKK
jgi:hypothetical protein